ncbi:unnamed protein product [Microthlaspi erraticum]|uniref:Uncharacterized protein n=1 Tax=Microthlaspi erraticum TaxID=1685480 RepID=A0A6D2KQ08_9BRAS|nr:unnamed protein product [Microthlaspi erraticum]
MATWLSHSRVFHLLVNQSNRRCFIFQSSRLLSFLSLLRQISSSPANLAASTLNRMSPPTPFPFHRNSSTLIQNFLRGLLFFNFTHRFYLFYLSSAKSVLLRHHSSAIHIAQFQVSEPGKWGYSADSKRVLAHFFGTQQIAFCSPADVEPFTEEKKQSLLTKPPAPFQILFVL